MADNVLVIPATVKVGRDFPQYLPLPNGDLKATPECSRADVEQARAEVRLLAEASRARLEQAYQEHLRDIELLAQLSAYLQKFDQWEAIRRGGEVRELLWQVELDD
jgi:hypothetical protein